MALRNIINTGQVIFCTQVFAMYLLKSACSRGVKEFANLILKIWSLGAVTFEDDQTKSYK